MIKVEEIRRGLWTFPIVLPNNPLKWLNCYVIKAEGSGKNLLIDTGFDKKECMDALLEGMSTLGIEPENTDVFITHLHSDHTGNGATLHRMGCDMLMGETDYHLFIKGDREGWRDGAARMTAEGLPPNAGDRICRNDRAVVFTSGSFPARLLHDGDLLSYGGYELECVITPGHTPGHMCLYERATKTMFLGDHVLFDITPNIGYWQSMEDSLGSYMDSLEKIREYDIDTALPGHRKRVDMTVSERVSRLIEHHRRRLDNAVDIISRDPYQNAYHIAGEMSWRIRAKNWDSFPPGQQYFALSETVAHLDHLVLEERIHRELNEDNIPVYYV